jgi:hypothetical protein
MNIWSIDFDNSTGMPMEYYRTRENYEPRQNRAMVEYVEMEKQRIRLETKIWYLSLDNQAQAAKLVEQQQEIESLRAALDIASHNLAELRLG